MVTPRFLTRLAAALAVCAVSLGLAATPVAYSDSVIRTQKYVDVLGLKKLHAEGLDGEGITIGLVDGHVDETVPELKGAKIQHKEYCGTLEHYSRDDFAHATAVASVLVSPYYGWAPKATLINYGRPVGDRQGGSVPASCKGKTTAGLLLNRMLNDKVDVVVMTVVNTFSADPVLGTALVRAADMGVPVVVGAGNRGTSGGVVDTADYNGVIAVGATDLTGKVTTFSNRGTGLTIMAPGTDVTTRQPEHGRTLSRIEAGRQGTSFSAPMVAGALALAKQKWPQSHGNQLIHSLISSAGRSTSGWNSTYGWGILNIRGLVDNDPRSHPTDNPVLAKTDGGLPGPKEIAAFRDGLAEAQVVRENDDYIYRGKDSLAAAEFPPERVKLGTSPRFQTASPAGTSPAVESPSPSPPAVSGEKDGEGGDGRLPWVIGIFAVLLVALGAGLTVFLQRRRRHQGPST